LRTFAAGPWFTLWPSCEIRPLRRTSLRSPNRTFHPSGLPVLILNTPLSERKVRLRVAAIEGFSKAGRMDARTEQALIALMRSGHLGIKRAAVRSHLTAAPAGAQRDARLARLKSVFPPQDHGLLSLSATQIDTVRGDRPEIERKKRERQRERSAPPQVTR
jgi:hypothetical protein